MTAKYCSFLYHKSKKLGGAEALGTRSSQQCTLSVISHNQQYLCLKQCIHGESFVLKGKGATQFVTTQPIKKMIPETKVLVNNNPANQTMFSLFIIYEHETRLMTNTLGRL